MVTNGLSAFTQALDVFFTLTSEHHIPSVFFPLLAISNGELHTCLFCHREEAALNKYDLHIIWVTHWHYATYFPVSGTIENTEMFVPVRAEWHSLVEKWRSTRIGHFWCDCLTDDSLFFGSVSHAALLLWSCSCKPYPRLLAALVSIFNAKGRPCEADVPHKGWEWRKDAGSLWAFSIELTMIDSTLSSPHQIDFSSV